MSEFLIDKNVVSIKPKGIDYDLEPGRICRLKTVRQFMSTKNILVKDGEICLPEKIYISEADELLINRILKHHKSTSDNTTGALFHGVQGCGKTMLAKILAKKSELPIIVIDGSFDTRNLVSFFTSFSTEVVILFDELDKHCDKDDNWDTKDMLEFLNGVQNTCKKLVLFTCNTDNIVNKFLKDRCGRIRYYRKFDVLNENMVRKIVSDYISVDKVDEIVEYICTNVKIPSYDNVVSICNELNNWPEYSIDLLIEDLNITKS